MLEHLPRPVGRALRGVRAGFEKVASEDQAFAHVPDIIAFNSPAFEDGASLPLRFTADGEGVSPPLAWSDAPPTAAAFAILVEDPDAPAAEPFVHLLVWDTPPDTRAISEGLFKSPDHQGLDENLGKNAFLQNAWLPPDPPPGHGAHLYVFQIFAIDCRLKFDDPPRRKAFLEALKGHVLARGMLVATYERN